MMKIIRSPFLFLFSAIILNAAGFGMMFPVLPFYAEEFGAGAVTIGLLGTFFAVAQFFTAPIWGRVSDRVGRKPILAVSFLGNALAFFIFALAPSLPWLFGARFLQGAFFAATFPVAMAYMGDMTSKENRVKFMGYLTASLSFGFIFGPLIGGLLSNFTLSLPFWVGAFLSLVNFFLVFFFLKESVSVKTERLMIREGLLNFKAVWHGLRGEHGLLFIFLFVWAFALSNMQVALPLLASKKFFLTASQVGYFFVLTGTVATLTQSFLLGRLARFFGEHRTVVLGALVMAFGLALVPLAPAVILIFGVLAVMVFGSASARPTTNGIISKEAVEGQGTALGIAFSFESLGRMAGPLVSGFLFENISWSVPFWFGSFLLVLIAVFLFRNPHFRKAGNGG